MSAGCDAQTPAGEHPVVESARPAALAQRAGPLHILALGDSYTIGEGVPEGEAWPALLATALEERGVKLDPLQIIAQTGWTSADLESALDRSALKPPYDLVTLLVGVNDQFQGYPESEYPQRFQRLLERALALTGGERGRVIVISIPDYSVTPFGGAFEPQAIRAALERYNDINRKVATSLGVAHVDITPISREAADDASLLAADHLHPSAKMYREWVQLLLPAAQDALRTEER
jgi:lysophospholipase L1-like esterase